MPATPPTNTPELTGHAPGRRGSSRCLSLLRGVLAAAVVGVLSVGIVSPAVADDTCVNAAVRAQTGSTGLPDCRGYEQVSAPYKEGFDIEQFTLRFTDKGIVSYGSYGSFADNPSGILLHSYHATRSATGWMTASVAPPDERYLTTNALEADSADLRWQLWRGYRRDVPGDKLGVYLGSPDGELTRIGDAEAGLGRARALVVGVSAADLSHVVLNYGNGSTMFEHVGTGNGPPRPASVDNHGQVQDGCFNIISPDGRVIVYTTGCPLGTPQVWARVAGSASVLVSGSECTRSPSDPGGACNAVSGASYRGGAADGSRVFFTTSQQLVNGDTDAGQDLYACDIPAGVPTPVGTANRCATLTEVSGAATDAKVDSVVSISADGSRVYFVAQGGVLADNLGVGGVGAVAGVPNLYVWERGGANPAGTTRFVTQLDTNDITQGQTTADGRYLLFLTASQLVTDGPGADTDSAPGVANPAVDAYRYDAVTKAMVRVSTSVSGAGGNGLFDVSLTPGASLMTADGSTVIFDTAEPLSAEDTNGAGDVYAWRDDGGVSLISHGGGASQAITPSGRDIFFTTNARVLATDRDPSIDLYDARVGGGFTPEQTTPCTGEQCQGQGSRPPSLPEPADAESSGLDAIEVSPAFSLRVVSAAQRRVLAATGRVSLVVSANAPGTIGVNAAATIGGRSVTVGSARRTLSAPGKVSVALTLSKRARSQLAVRGKLAVKVTVSHSKVALDRSVTLRLVKAKRSAKGASGQRSVVGERGGRS